MKNNKEKDQPIVFTIVKWMIKHITLCSIILLAIFIFFISTYRWWNWQVLGAIATWVLAAGVGVAVWQVSDNRYHADEQAKQARNSTNAQIALDLFFKLRSSDSMKILRSVYSKKSKSIEEVKSNIKVEDIDLILDNLGIVGRLIIQDILDEKLAIEAFGGVSVIRCWYQFGGYIKELRRKRGLQYGSYFEDFASRALEHFKNFKSDWIRMYHGEGDESFDLIQELLKDEKLRPKRLNEQNGLPQ
jgi:hypothetical protein